jgi:broad specificity phosphatase PhoE
MKEIYIIRHGETALNKLGIVQGRGIDSDLNETGRVQAEAFYKHYKEVKFDKIYTSSLKRTHQTVNNFITSGIPWQALKGFDELAWGVWEGQQSSTESISAFREITENWQSGNYDSKFDGGESPNEVQFRLQEAMGIVKAETTEQCILICMHGRAMRLLLCVLLGKPLSEMGDFPHQNTTLYRLNYKDDKFDLIDFNNIDHLKDLIDSH